MNLQEYADAINADINMMYYANQQRWTCCLDGAEVMNDGMLESAYGNGKEPFEAMANYVKIIKGARIVFNASHENRLELNVPKSLTLD